MRKEINFFLNRFFQFVLFTIIFYPLFICAWGEVMPNSFQKNLNYYIGQSGHMYTRIREIKHYNNVDILFIGSSHAYRGFDTRIFRNAGYSNFNLGSSQQTPINTRVLLNRYLDKLNPEIIIYEVYPGTFSVDGIESSLDIISNDRNDFQSIKMAISQNHIKVYNTLIYAFYRDIFNRNSDFIEPLKKDDDYYIPGGYVERKLKHFQYVTYDRKNRWPLKDYQFTEFENVLQIINKRKVKLFLVQAPITKRRYNSFINNHIFDKRMHKYGDYYNFNKIIELDDSLHFYDSHHLNKNGVELFNNKLIHLLLED